MTILTIVSPVKALIGQAEEIGTHFASLLQPSAVETDEKRASFEQAAYAIFSYAEERYGFDPAGAEITFFTDEDGEADELMIFFESGSPADRDRLQTDLEKELGILVHIFLERREADESGGEDGNSG